MRHLVSLLVLCLVVTAVTSCGSTSTPTSSQPTANLAGSPVTVGTVAGTVADTAGEELIGAVVTVQGISAKSDHAGRYRLDNVPAGSGTATVTSSGYLPLSSTVTVQAGAVTTWDPRMSQPAGLRGTVYDARTNLPLASATVTVGTSSATSGVDGTYSVLGLAAGTQTVTATAGGFTAGAATVDLEDNETATQDFSLHPLATTGAVKGTVTDAVSGFPLGGVQLSIGTATATSDPRGAYLLAAAPSGTQVLKATLTGYVPWQATVEVGDQTVVTRDVEISQPGKTGRVKGQVLDMNTNAAVEGALVSIGARSTLTDKHGDFTIASVPRGTPTITVVKLGCLTQSDSVLVEPDAVNDKYLTVSTTPLRKGPYMLYTNETTSMTVQWQTFTTPARSTIEWGETTAYGHTAEVEENSAAMGEHRFSYTIAGLAPSTKMFVRVKVDGQAATASFTSAPPATDETLTFYAYGDTRSNHAVWGSENDHDAVCGAIMTDMKAAAGRQTIILHDGDVVRHGLDESYWDTQYFMRAWPHQIDLEASVPAMTAIGNHECYLSNEDGVDYATGGALLKKYWPYPMFPRSDRFYYSFDYGPLHVAVVDNWMHPDYAPGTDQNTWLKNDLAATTKPWKIVFMHTPIWDCNTVDHAMVDGLGPIFKQAGVRLVIAGHAHHYCRCIVDGITYLTMGGGGAPLGPLAHPYNPESAPYVQVALSTFHFGRFQVSKDAIDATIVMPTGMNVDTFTIRR